MNKTLNWKRGKRPHNALNTKMHSNIRTTALEMLIVFMFLLQNSPTKLEPADRDMWRKLAAGSRDPVLYRLDFPVSSPLPTIKSITVNKNVICSGTRPSKYQSIPKVLHSHCADLSVSLILPGPSIITAYWISWEELQETDIFHLSQSHVFLYKSKVHYGLYTSFWVAQTLT
jgi:hypothetical protein